MQKNSPSVTARLAVGPKDAVFLRNVLRQKGRWETLGVALPAGIDPLSTPISIACMSGITKQRTPSFVLVYAIQKKYQQVIAILMLYGWEYETDRCMGAIGVPLDIGSFENLKYMADKWCPTDAAHVLYTPFETLQIRTYHLHKTGFLGTLLKHSKHLLNLPTAALKAPPLSNPIIRIDSRFFAALPGMTTNKRIRAAMAATDKQQSKPFEPTITSIKKSLTACITVRNPAIAHRHLIQSSGPLRNSFFPLESSMPTTVETLVVGAGVAGLTAAYCIGRATQKPVTVLEIWDRSGGTGMHGTFTNTDRDTTTGLDTVADAQQGKGADFPLGAHYEHDPADNYGKEVIKLWQHLNLLDPNPTTLANNSVGYQFTDKQHYVNLEREEQMLDLEGALHRDPWESLTDLPKNDPFLLLLQRYEGQFPLPSRLASTEIKALQNISFDEFLHQQKVTLTPLHKRLITIGMRSDYGAGTNTVNAFSTLHFLLCRPYLSGKVGTFSPPKGLSYFTDKMLEKSTHIDLHLQHMVRRITKKETHYELQVLDLAQRRTRLFYAQNIVYAAPKKGLRYIYPAQAAPFRENFHHYAAWITVTMTFSDLPEKDQLFWSNGIMEPTERYIGVVWDNHINPEAPPILTHYLSFPPGRSSHFKVWLANPHTTTAFCLQQLGRLLGRDISSSVTHVVIQKLGHSMPTPTINSLFKDPNHNRNDPHFVFAGVDTGRLPLLIEATDSGIQAAAELGHTPFS